MHEVSEKEISLRQVVAYVAPTDCSFLCYCVECLYLKIYTWWDRKSKLSNCLLDEKYKKWDARGTRSRPCSFTSLIWCQNVHTRCFTPLTALSLRYNLSSLQDRRWMGRNQHRKWSNHSDVTEPEYDVVEDQEEALDVRILPARPMHDETEYAGKWGDYQL